MKNLSLLIASSCLLLTTAFHAPAQGTAFTYQGRLNDGASSANGIYELRFTMYDALAAGNVVSRVLTNAATTVSNGLFTTTLDFGVGVFTGAERWLEVGVRTNGSPNDFTALAPRQPITASPYAIFSASSGSVSNGLVQDPLFLGTTGSTPLELFAGSQRALRLEPNTNGAPNVIGGSVVNQVDPGIIGATISGGGAVNYFGSSIPNRVSGDFSAIGGGLANTIQGPGSVIAGGVANQIQTNSYWSAISGGGLNVIETNAGSSAIGGGQGNVIRTDVAYSSVVGGRYNTNASWDSVIAGGFNNMIEPNGGLSSIGGGWLNIIHSGADQSAIAGGNAVRIEPGARNSFIGGGFNNAIQTASQQAAIGGGAHNRIGADSVAAMVGGGSGNTIASNNYGAAISGGWINTIQTGSGYSFIGSGQENAIKQSAGFSAIGGGIQNSIGTNASRSFVGGGFGNSVGNNSVYGTIAGGLGNSISNNVQRATVAGGFQNSAAANHATVGGGYQNFASGNFNISNGDSATVAGGYQNAAMGNNATVAGGYANLARGDNTAIGGGWMHTNLTGFGVIGGGQQHLLEPFARFSVIAGGDNNTIQSNSTHAVISGGQFNTIGTNAIYATIPGGVSNLAAGAYSFAAGRRAKAMHRGTFVWADSQEPNFVSSASNQFLIRASGGVGIGVTNPAAALHVAGTVKASAFEGSDGPLMFTTGNNQPVEFKANGMRILRLEYAGDSETDPDTAPDGAPNVIGGAPNNVVPPGVVGATIAGGGATNLFGFPYPNSNAADFGAIGGGAGNTIQSNAAASVIAGGFVNRILNTNITDAASIGGGLGNEINSGARHATIAGGAMNEIGVDAADATIGGGSDNLAAGRWAVIGGGRRNTNFAEASIIGGGNRNVIGIDATHSVIAGGDGNRATGLGATVPGGISNTASGSYSFAAGHRANASHTGSFVWSDYHEEPFGTTADNQFLVRADFVGINRNFPITGAEFFGVRAPVTNTYGGMYVETAGPGKPFYGYVSSAGGNAWTYLDGLDGNTWKVNHGGDRLTVTPTGNIGINNNNPAERLHVNGNILATGTITPNSDRNAKTDIVPTDAATILERVAQLPIQQWRFKAEREGVKHIGPMAQDFHAAFGLGERETAIATVDADGVALAAIQGLNQKLEEKEARIRFLEETVAELKEIISELRPGGKR